MNIQDMIITVWCGYQTLDEYGRLGSMVGVYRNLSDASVGVKNQGWYGGPGRVIEKKAIRYGEDIYPLEVTRPWAFKDVTELREKDKQEKLAAIRDKLTDEEFELLKGSLK